MNGEGKRPRLDQRRAPIHEALETFRKMRVVPFDVPGHKRGRGNPELTAFLGEQCVGVPVGWMPERIRLRFSSILIHLQLYHSIVLFTIA